MADSGPDGYVYPGSWSLPDPSFGDGGAVSIPGAFGVSVISLVADELGRILVAASDADGVLLHRLMTDGSMDTSFGDGGQVRISAVDTCTELLLDGSGRIVLVGKAPAGLDSQPYVARLLADGSLDSTFGTEGFSYAFPLGPRTAGSAALRRSGGAVVEVTGLEIHQLVAIDETGALDTSWGDGGVVERPSASMSGGAGLRLLVPASDGVFAATGFPDSGIEGIEKLSTDGSLDTTFGDSGRVSTGGQFFTLALAPMPDGGIAFTGQVGLPWEDAAYGRFDARGNVVVPITYHDSGREYVQPLALAATADGRTWLAGEMGGITGVWLVLADGTFADWLDYMGAWSIRPDVRGRFTEVVTTEDGVYFGGETNTDGLLIVRVIPPP